MLASKTFEKLSQHTDPLYVPMLRNGITACVSQKGVGRRPRWTHVYQPLTKVHGTRNCCSLDTGGAQFEGDQ